MLSVEKKNMFTYKKQVGRQRIERQESNLQPGAIKPVVFYNQVRRDRIKIARQAFSICCGANIILQRQTVILIDYVHHRLKWQA